MIFFRQIILCLGLMACGEAKNTSTSGTTLFFPSDFRKPDNTTTIASSEFSSAFADLSEMFYANAPYNERACYADIINAVQVEAKDDTYSFHRFLDVKHCMEEDLRQQYGTDAIIDVRQAAIEYFVSKRCVGKDVSSLDRKTIEDVENAHLCDNADTIEIIENSIQQTDIIITDKDGDATVTITLDSTEKYALQGSDDGKPCRMQLHETSYVYDDQCFEMSHSDNVSRIAEDESEERSLEFLTAKYVGIKKRNDKSSLWFETGRMDLDWNDWQGSINYVDATTAPRYTMANRTETKTGDVTSARTTLRAAGSLRHGEARIPSIRRTFR